MPVFMQQIDDARGAPLEALALDYLRPGHRVTIDFCRRVAGVSVGLGVAEAAIARRLGVPVIEVRAWLQIGRR